MSLRNKAIQKQSHKRNSVSAFSNVTQIDAENPVPFKGNGSLFSIVNRYQYLPFLNASHNYGQQITEIRLLSVTQNACVSTKRNYCAGEGIHASDIDPDNLKEDYKYKAIQEWLSCLNLESQSAMSVNRDIYDSFFTYGNAPIELVRSKVLGEKRLFVYPCNFLEWRLSTPDKDDICTHAIYSKQFLTGKIIGTLDKESNREIPIYNPLNTDRRNWKKMPDGTERTIIWYRNKISGVAYYGLPSSIPSLIYQMLEYKAARYNLDNFENNLVAAALLVLKGSHSDSEVKNIAREIIKTHTGDGKRGRTVVLGSEEGIDGSELHKLDTKADGSFNDADNLWSQKIILANEWDATLAGLVSGSTLGKGSGYLTKIIENKLNTVIRPAQTDLYEKVWKPIFKEAQAWLGLSFDKYNLRIKNSIDISGPNRCRYNSRSTN